MLSPNYELFSQKVGEVFFAHDMEAARKIDFSVESKKSAMTGEWELCLEEFAEYLKENLSSYLTDSHIFLDSPYVRKVAFPNGKFMNISIINQQSKEWYGSDHFLATCDFLVEESRGLFNRCERFLDLGGHQMIWAIYYAITKKTVEVVSFEPSVLNVLIGLFNCLINDVIDRVEIIPFAASVEINNGVELSKMLVDYMNVPLRSVCIDSYLQEQFDFIKTDIEGYEYELLSSKKYVESLKNSKAAHFELHLGHLWKRGVSVQDCIDRLRHSEIVATEFYTGKDMYEFLGECDPDSFPAFVIDNQTK